MSDDPQAELLLLTQALRAHAQWLAATGASGLAPCDSEWKTRRRQQYRAASERLATPAEHPDATPQYSSPAVEEHPSAAAGRPGATASAATAAEPEPSLSPTERRQPPVPLQVVPPADEVLPPRAPHDPKAQAAPTASSSQNILTERHASANQPPAETAPGSRDEAVSWPEHLAPRVRVEETAKRLQVLSQEVSSCVQCVLHEQRTNTVFARGTGRSGLVFVGEGPGADEDAQGVPFVGKAGQLLDRMVAAMGFERDDVYVCNIVKCRPPKNRKPELSEMNACRPFIEQQLELIEPRVIVALGATAVQGLLGLGVGITRLRGKWRLYNGAIPVMPTFHPAYLLRNPAAKRQVWDDLQAVLKELGVPAPAKR